MSTPVAQNPAATNPRKALTPSQRDCLIAIDFYRHQHRVGPEIVIGRKRFKASTIDVLEGHGLVKKRGASYAPTLAGDLAVSKLKGDTA